MLDKFYDDMQSQVKNIRKILHPDNNILLITHKGCMDGHGCQMVMEKNFNNVFTVKLSPQDVDDYVYNLNPSDFDGIILADISTADEQFLRLENVMMVDHHESAMYLYDPTWQCFVYDFECGTKLLSRVVEVALKKSQKPYKDLINLINDNDMWLHQDPRSHQLQKHFYNVKNDEFTERFWSFKVNFTDEENTQYKQIMDDIENKFNECNIFDFDHINAGCIIGYEYINDLCHMALEKHKYDFIVFYNPRSKNGSIRCSNELIDVGKMLSELQIGGGHKLAAGFRSVDLQELKNHLNLIESYILKNYSFSKL